MAQFAVSILLVVYSPAGILVPVEVRVLSIDSDRDIDIAISI